MQVEVAGEVRRPLRGDGRHVRLNPVPLDLVLVFVRAFDSRVAKEILAVDVVKLPVRVRD